MDPKPSTYGQNRMPPATPALSRKAGTRHVGLPEILMVTSNRWPELASRRTIPTGWVTA